MSFRNLLPTSVDVRRLTDVLRIQDSVRTSMSLDRQPSGVAVKLLLKISGGTNNSGTITIIGTVSGISTTENFTFLAAGFKESTNLFSDVTTITSSGFTDEATVANLEILARSAAGQPVYQEILAFTRKMRVSSLGSSRYRYQTTGAIPEATNKFFCEHVTSELIQEKDILLLPDGSRFEILPFDTPWDRYKVHHIEIPAKQLL